MKRLNRGCSQGLAGVQEEIVPAPQPAEVDLVHTVALASRLSVLMIAGFS
jgi:hypothetical protein